MIHKTYADVHGPYTQRSVSARAEALFLDNLGKVVTREHIIAATTDPKTGRVFENWHQRISELRTDKGYTILTRRDRSDLGASEYLMIDATRRASASKRVRPTAATWAEVLKRADHSCEWHEAGEKCGLAEGAVDPVGGGTVKLTPDHMQPHSERPSADPNDPADWQALCGRHQVVKKNFWNSTTGKLNTRAIVQAASVADKHEAFDLLLDFFGYHRDDDGTLRPQGSQ